MGRNDKTTIIMDLIRKLYSQLTTPAFAKKGVQPKKTDEDFKGERGFFPLIAVRANLLRAGNQYQERSGHRGLTLTAKS